MSGARFPGGKLPQHTVAALLVVLNLFLWVAGSRFPSDAAAPPPAPAGAAGSVRTTAGAASPADRAARMQMLALFADNLPEPTTYPEVLDAIRREAHTLALPLRIAEKPWIAPPGAPFLHAPVQLSLSASRKRLHAFVRILLEHNGALVLEEIHYHPRIGSGAGQATLDLLLVMKP